MYNSLFVWDAGQLVQSALNAQQAGRKLTVPIDRLTMTGEQLPEATATRYDKTSDGNLFGTIYGVGAYAAKQGLPTVTLQNVPHLQALAPSVYNAAKTAAEQAHEPIAPPLTPLEGTVNTLSTRLWAQANIFLSTVWGSGQALLGQDNSETLASIKESQHILETVGYDTKNGTTLEVNAASAAQAVEGLVGGITSLATNFVGTVLRVGTKIGSFFGGSRPELPATTEYLQELDTESLAHNISYVAFATLRYNPVTLAAEALQSTELKPPVCMTAKDEALNVRGFWAWNGPGCAESSSERA